MLTKQQRDEFMTRGFVRVPGAFTREAAAAMEACFWRFLEQRQGIRRDDRSTWVGGLVHGISDLKYETEFEQIGSTTTISVLDDLLGTGHWQRPSTWGQILATFPAEDGTWSWKSLLQGRDQHPRIQWHTDYEYTSPPDELAGVQVFALLADLESGGGATLVVEGSPRVIERFVLDQPPERLKKMKQARLALMRSDPWFHQISKPASHANPKTWLADHQAEIDGIPLAVAELTGKAGDVVFCHPWLLHATSPNRNETPRLMCTQRIRKRSQSD